MYDALPPSRADVRVLFGVELHRLGIVSDLVGQVSIDAHPDLQWRGGCMLPQGDKRKGIWGEFVRPFQDFLGMVRYLTPEHRIIQVRDKIRTGVLAWVVARLTGRKVVYWMSFPFADGFSERAQEVGRSKGWAIWIANWSRAWLAGLVYYRFLARRMDHVFVQSDEMLRMMQCKAGVMANRMTSVPMGIDSAWLGRNRSALLVQRPATLAGRRVVAYIGTLARSRRPEFILRVFEAVHAQMPSTFLLLIGDAPSPDERDSLRKLISDSNCADSIYLTGWLDPDEGQRWLYHAEVGLSPIPRRILFDVGSPTKAIEYIALGIPCVGNNNPDQEHVLLQSGAGMCVPLNVNAFACATLQILSSPQLAAELSAKGPGWVASHRTYRVIAPRVADIYRRILNS